MTQLMNKDAATANAYSVFNHPLIVTEEADGQVYVYPPVAVS